jgi:hypothetical protein
MLVLCRIRKVKIEYDVSTFEGWFTDFKIPIFYISNSAISI